MDSQIIFNSIVFLGIETSPLYDDPETNYELYNLVSNTHQMNIELTFKHEWKYKNFRPNFAHNASEIPLSHLRDNLIINAKNTKIEYYSSAFKNLNLIRHKLHRDLIPQIVMIISNLRHPHYLETVEI